MRTSQLVNFRGQDEITLGESIDLVRPNCYLGTAPTKTDVRMMALFFGEFSGAVDELLRLAEVSELVKLLEVVFVNNFPAIQLS